MSETELAAMEIGSLCPFGKPMEISVEELVDASADSQAGLDAMNVATAGAFVRSQGYAIEKLTRCRIVAEDFADEVAQAGLGGFAKLLGGDGNAQITTVSAANEGALVELHFVESSKRCWPRTARVQEDRLTGSALWQHEKREVGLWCFNKETVDIDPACGADLLEALMQAVPASATASASATTPGD